MEPKYEMPEEIKNKMKKYILSHDITNGIKAINFIEIMKTHHGMIDVNRIDDETWSDLKNPVVCALGDSVTAGHFEMIDIHKGLIAQNSEECYAEKFLHMIHAVYPLTTSSLINSGIAGDNIHGMNKRLERDVLRYKPDLVILNAVLNWSEHRGTLEEYIKNYEEVIFRIRTETSADVILTTGNGTLCIDEDGTDQRNEYIRETAEKHKLPLVDFRRIFDESLKPEELVFTLSNAKFKTIVGDR
jgi:hypothetical protein